MTETTDTDIISPCPTLEAIDDRVSSMLGGEPVFTLRAQDVFAAGLVANWALNAAAMGVPAAKVARAWVIAKAMQAWPNKKVPD